MVSPIFPGLPREYLRNESEADRIFAKGKKIEVVYAIISKGIPLFRTEGVGDVTLLEINVQGKTVSVPAILPEKVQAKLRRQMLEILRAHITDNIKNKIKEYKNMGYLKVGDDGSWNCYVSPPLGGRVTEMDIGMCGFCPACTILGTVLTRNELAGAGTSYGLKSRVVHDVAYAVTTDEKAVIVLTHTKVGDGVSYTGRSLFEESHVIPGIVFVGKSALYDVTEREAKLVLAGLSNIRRLGAGETKYGAVQTILLGTKGGMFETISSYDIARYIMKKYSDRVEPEIILKEIIEYLRQKNFNVINIENKTIDEIEVQVNITKDDIEQLWAYDNYNYASQVVKYINRVER